MCESEVLLSSKSHEFLAVFAQTHSKINQIAQFFDEIIQEFSDQTCMLKISTTCF
jgi:hypothetical protein